jgi:hypothetical protein
MLFIAFWQPFQLVNECRAALTMSKRPCRSSNSNAAFDEVSRASLSNIVQKRIEIPSLEVDHGGN